VFHFRSIGFPVSDMLPLPAIHASHGGCWLRDGHGATRTVAKGDAIVAAADTPLLMLNAPLVATRLGYPDLSGLDLLELFAFVHPSPVHGADAQGPCPCAGPGRTGG
jgi:ATP-dependent DNA helicase DinG